jgi:NitT/TauT family transport system substrate-binding protein
MHINPTRLPRRHLLGAAAGTALLSVAPGARAATTQVSLQLGWLIGGNQLGDIAAMQLGYFKDEGIDLRIDAGGPNNDGVAVVASGRDTIGQLSSSPSLMLAASQDIPVRCIAVGAQKHPYAFFSLSKNPVRKPADLKGKRVGIQATGVILLRALLAKNGMSESDVKIVTLGSDMAPLLTGQVDVITGWVTNTTALAVLGPDVVTMLLWDAGVHLYALPYYATDDTLRNHKDALVRFVRAAAKGWAYAHANPDKAVALMIKAYPNLVEKDELAAAKTMLAVEFTEATKKSGWGAMEPAVWQEQIDLWAQLKQFTKKTPKLNEVMTMDILNATTADRPRIG